MTGNAADASSNEALAKLLGDTSSAAFPDYTPPPPPFRVVIVADMAPKPAHELVEYEPLASAAAWIDAAINSLCVEHEDGRVGSPDDLNGAIVEMVDVRSVEVRHIRTSDAILVVCPHSHHAAALLTAISNMSMGIGRRASTRPLLAAMFHLGGGQKFNMVESAPALSPYDLIITPDNTTAVMVRGVSALKDKRVIVTPGLADLTAGRTIRNVAFGKGLPEGRSNGLSNAADSRGCSPWAGKKVNLWWAEGINHPAFPFFLFCVRALLTKLSSEDEEGKGILKAAPQHIQVIVVTDEGTTQKQKDAFDSAARDIMISQARGVAVSFRSIQRQVISGARHVESADDNIVVVLAEDQFGVPLASLELAESRSLSLLSSGGTIDGDTWNTTYITPELPECYRAGNESWTMVTGAEAFSLIFEAVPESRIWCSEFCDSERPESHIPVNHILPTLRSVRAQLQRRR